MSNIKLSEKDLEAVSGGISSTRDWLAIGSYILENCQKDPQYGQLEPDLSELQSYCAAPGNPTSVRTWVYKHTSFAIVQEALQCC